MTAKCNIINSNYPQLITFLLNLEHNLNIVWQLGTQRKTSFQLEKPQKATRMTKEYRKYLLVLAKNDAKQRLRNYNIEGNDLSQELMR